MDQKGRCILNQPAGFWIRLGANLLDGLIIGIPVFIISTILLNNEGNQELFVNVISAIYSLLLPVLWNGYTVGKRLCNIRIRRIKDQQPPGIGTMLLRNIVAGLVYALTLGIGSIVSAIMVGVREDKRAIHDFIAGTEVVHD